MGKNSLISQNLEGTSQEVDMERKDKKTKRQKKKKKRKKDSMGR